MAPRGKDDGGVNHGGWASHEWLDSTTFGKAEPTDWRADWAEAGRKGRVKKMAFGFRTGATGGTVEPSLLAEPGKTGAGAYLRRDINSLLFKDKCLEVQPWAK